MSEDKGKKEMLFEMGKEAIIINCRLFPENAAEIAIKLLDMHKGLYPELYEEKQNDKPEGRNETLEKSGREH